MRGNGKSSFGSNGNSIEFCTSLSSLIISATILRIAVEIERWWPHYNTVNPHSALGYRPPAPQAVATRRADPAFAMAGLQPDQSFPEVVLNLAQKLVQRMRAGHPEQNIHSLDFLEHVHITCLSSSTYTLIHGTLFSRRASQST